VVEAAVIISKGENGKLDEENGDNDGVYETKSPTETFDDLVTFLNPEALWSKLCGSYALLTVNNSNCAPWVDIYENGNLRGRVRFGDSRSLLLTKGASIEIRQGGTTCCTFTLSGNISVRTDCRLRCRCIF